MAEPKKPQDHKQKVERAKETDITIVVDGEEVTVRGYRVTVGDRTVEIEKDAVNSWEFAESASEHDIVRMSKVLLGDQYEAIRDSFRNGRFTDLKAFGEFVNAVVEAFPNS